MTPLVIAQLVAVIAAGVLMLAGVFRSRTVGALVLAYVVVQSLYYSTGTVLSNLELFWIDLACIAIICTRRPVAACWQRGAIQLAICVLWRERTPCDRIVLACFPPTWAVYWVFHANWNALWVISMFQLLVASWEATRTYLTRRGPSTAPNEDEHPPGSVEFAWVGSSRGAG